MKYFAMSACCTYLALYIGCVAGAILGATVMFFATLVAQFFV